MKKIILGMMLLISLSNSAFATVGYLKGEKTSGMNKMCYYDVLGSTYTLNIGSIELCPLSANF